ncbi:MAG: hypothetical protein LC803_06280 [Acidobacteria bacterium]|nr:hypothetical protein [Acidobacteriota bacterium]
MNKKAVAVTLVVFAMLVSISAALVRGSNTVHITFNVKDVPNDGLEIVSPTHSEFSNMKSELLKKKQNVFSEDTTPAAVFIKNKSKKDVVAYILKWEVTRSDGRVETIVNSYSRPDILMGKKTYKDENLRASLVLRSNKARFFSLSESSAQGFEIGLGTEANNDSAASVGQAVGIGTSADIKSDDLAEVRSITVSIDGAFFDDGIFVGENNTRYFERTKAEINAKFDMLQDIKNRLKSGDKPSDVMKHLEDVSSALRAPESLIGPDEPVDVYNFFRKMYHNEVLQRRAIVGSDELLLNRVLLSTLDAWPILRKSDSTKD